MSIGGVIGGSQGPMPYGPRPLGPGANGSDPRIHERPAQQPAAQPAPLAAPAFDDAVPLEAPPGTDPVLWSVLTAEERRHFSKLQALGPLTYGPRPAPVHQPGLVRGGRIDTTV